MPQSKKLDALIQRFEFIKGREVKDEYKTQNPDSVQPEDDGGKTVVVDTAFKTFLTERNTY